MIVEQSKAIVAEVSKALLGKRDVIEKTLMAIYAGGHVLLEDVPGTGKTTLALALSRALDLDYKRVQFTPDTMPPISRVSRYTCATKASSSSIGVR